MKLSERKRLAIIDTAEHLFCGKGLEFTSMVEIAQQAEVSKRTLYNHFANKELLFYAVLQRAQNQVGVGESIGFCQHLPIDEQLERIAQNEVKLLRSKPFIRIAKMALMQMMKQPELAQQMSSMKVGCMVYFESFLQDACNANVLKVDDIELAAKQFVYQLKSFIFYPHLFNFEQLTIEQEQYMIKQSVEMFLARYKV